MANRNKKIGKWGEDLAAVYLEEKGYLILDRNVYTSYGEIDIITFQEDDNEKCAEQGVCDAPDRERLAIPHQ